MRGEPQAERPPLKRVTVRMATAPHAFVAVGAERAGVNLSNYMREAALMRAAWENGIYHGRRSSGKALELAEWTAELVALREELRQHRLLHDGPATE